MATVYRITINGCNQLCRLTLLVSRLRRQFMGLLPDTQNWAKCACAGNSGNVFPANDFKGRRYLAIPACTPARAHVRAVAHVGIAQVSGKRASVWITLPNRLRRDCWWKLLFKSVNIRQRYTYRKRQNLQSCKQYFPSGLFWMNKITCLWQTAHWMLCQ